MSTEKDVIKQLRYLLDFSDDDIFEENCLFDEESPFNDHSHEITISMFNLESISNCSVGTRHSKLLVLTILGGGDGIFNKCKLEDVSEIDLFKKNYAWTGNYDERIWKFEIC